jgi:hypothetical protein
MAGSQAAADRPDASLQGAMDKVAANSADTPAAADMPAPSPAADTREYWRLAAAQALFLVADKPFPVVEPVVCLPVASEGRALCPGLDQRLRSSRRVAQPAPAPNRGVSLCKEGLL